MVDNDEKNDDDGGEIDIEVWSGDGEYDRHVLNDC